MFTKIIAKLLNKKLYRSTVTIVSDNFTANHHSDSLIESLKWTLHGLYESGSSHIKSDKDSRTIFGQICEFKILHFSRNSISICGYKKPKTSELLFMTNQMVYIPETILDSLKKQELTLTEIDNLLLK